MLVENVNLFFLVNTHIMEYNFSSIEEKWQKYWREKKVYSASNNSDLPKYYVLDMFPYPSGSGLLEGFLILMFLDQPKDGQDRLNITKGLERP